MPGGPGPAETGPAGAGPAGGGPAGGGPAEAGPRSRAGGPGRWWRRRSLRARVTLASPAGLALALAAAAVLLSGAPRRRAAALADPQPGHLGPAGRAGGRRAVRRAPAARPGPGSPRHHHGPGSQLSRTDRERVPGRGPPRP